MYSLYSVAIYCDKGEGVLSITDGSGGGDIYLPMGRINIGENPREAAVRVLKEKTGYEINPGYLSIVHQTNIDNENVLLVYYASSSQLTGTMKALNGDGKIIAWASEKSLCAGTFGRLNKDILSHI